MKLGGIGYGLISGAILGGIVNNDLVKPENITISDKFEGSRKRAVEAGFTAVDDNMIAAKNDVLLVAVQPWLVPAIMDEIKDTVKENEQSYGVLQQVLQLQNWKNIWGVMRRSYVACQIHVLR